MNIPAPRPLLTWLALAFALCACQSNDSQTQWTPAAQTHASNQEETMLIQYLEIVTPEVEATCEALARMHAVTFGEPVVEFGNARQAALKGGGQIGVRAPMAPHETPVVRPYALVDDIESALDAAKAAGAEIAMGATEMPGQGQFAIYVLGGIQHGLWQK